MILRVHLVGSHARWKRPYLPTQFAEPSRLDPDTPTKFGARAFELSQQVDGPVLTAHTDAAGM
jgi:hypothetical protein